MEIQTADTSGSEQSIELILEYIKQLLINSDLRPGDRMPEEKKLAEQLRVSRSGVREAIAALNLTGVLEARKEGLFVRQAQSEGVVEPLRLVFSMAHEQVQAVIEARLAIEIQAAGLAARRREKCNVLALEMIINSMRDDLTDRQRSEQLDLEFHMEITKATQNRLLNRMISSVQAAIYKTLRLTRSLWLAGTAGTEQDLYEQHQAIFAAVRDGDAQSARDLMHRHLAVVETCNAAAEKFRPQGVQGL
ncbi:MAG: FadR family transcriptional regulator [Gracilibacteraceae bacterium]|jgi:GntR family transcriptional repressor for pyruvate dehydrogenase complex|nr:FadR family transcriptional regulator [Gracilibacteraceae bacterium]